jgi:prophage tail gpP-like protein
MAFELVTVEAGGYQYSTWTEATAEAGAQQAARSFSIIASEPDQLFSEAWPLRPGTDVAVKASGSLIVKGYIDTYSPEFGDGYHRAVISGRSKTKDVIDSSAIHKTGEFKKKTILDIGKELLKDFNVELQSAIADLTKFPVWRLAPGATVFNELEVMARQDRALLIGTADGNLKLTRADQFQMHAGALIEGVNIQQASAQLSEKHRHDKVHARGQKRLGSGEDAHRLEYVSRDKTVERHRPLLVLAEGDTDKDRLKNRAKWQVARAAGWSTQATIVVPSWRDEAGELWDPEKLVFVESRKLKISQVMAIRQVRFLQNNDQGTIATLTLVDPQALGGKDAKGQSNDAWDTGEE